MNGSGSRPRYLSSKASRPENRGYFPIIHPDTFHPSKWPEDRQDFRPGSTPVDDPFDTPDPIRPPKLPRDRPSGVRGGPNKPGVRPRPPRNPDAPRSPRPSVPRPPRKRKK